MTNTVISHRVYEPGIGAEATTSTCTPTSWIAASAVHNHSRVVDRRPDGVAAEMCTLIPTTCRR
jgi:hypothetical protein